MVQGGQTYFVFDLLMPYTKNSQIYQCPTEPRAYDYPALVRRYTLSPQNNLSFGSFVPNAGLFTAGCNAQVVVPRPVRTVSQIQFPADQPTFYDGFLTGGLDLPVWGRQQNGMILALADGHSRYMKIAN